jgi:hypothetical protein
MISTRTRTRPARRHGHCPLRIPLQVRANPKIRTVFNATVDEFYSADGSLLTHVIVKDVHSGELTDLEVEVSRTRGCRNDAPCSPCARHGASIRPPLRAGGVRQDRADAKHTGEHLVHLALVHL